MDYNTQSILQALRQELQAATEAYEIRPDYELLQTIRFIEAKIKQFTQRAEASAKEE